jgi:hypothetical protein
MKVVTPGASRLKATQSQAGSPDKSKHGKQRAEYMRIQAQQQVRVWMGGPLRLTQAMGTEPLPIPVSTVPHRLPSVTLSPRHNWPP